MFRNPIKVIIALAVVANFAVAESKNDQAIKDTQELLLDQTQRQEIIQKGGDAQRADQALKELAGSPQMSEEIYALAADIFGSMATRSGDPESLLRDVQNLQANPQALEQKLSPQQRAKLRALAERLQNENPKLKQTP